MPISLHANFWQDTHVSGTPPESNTGCFSKVSDPNTVNTSSACCAIQLPGNEKGAFNSAKSDYNHAINPSFWKGGIFLAQTLMHLRESCFQFSLTPSSSYFENAAGHIFFSKSILIRQQISTKSSHDVLPRDVNPCFTTASLPIPGMVHIHTLSITYHVTIL